MPRWTRAAVLDSERARARGLFPQGRQDSNLQPPVLETGALPIELRPSVRAKQCRHDRRVPLVALFTVLTLAFAGIAAGSAVASEWVIAVAAAAIAAWMGSFALAALRRTRR